MVAMARSFLKEKHLPSELWGEAVRHSVYILNHLPTRTLSGKTPFEAWTRNKPDVGHIRTFGCLAYMKVPSAHVKKLDDRSKVTVYLGKEPGTKAFRLYDPESGRILVSRDVVDESKTWTWDTQACEGQISPEKFTVANVYSVVEQGQEQETHMPEDEETSGSSMGTVNAQPQGSPAVNSPQSSSSSQPESSSCSSEPREFRLLSDIYDETHEVELDDELLLLGIDEPNNFYQVVAEQEWRQAMESELDAIERNNT